MKRKLNIKPVIVLCRVAELLLIIASVLLILEGERIAAAVMILLLVVTAGLDILFFASKVKYVEAADGTLVPDWMAARADRCPLRTCSINGRCLYQSGCASEKAGRSHES
jgi:hypothetical protein